jgi:signal transduction histidine kinase
LTLSVLVGLTLLTAVSTALSWQGVTQSQDLLRNRIRPAQVAAADLPTAFVEQEAGQRGYLLTGEQTLLPLYVAAREDGRKELASLRSLLAFDGESSRLLDLADVAARAWQTKAVEPGIAARQHGLLTADQLRATVDAGKLLYDPLRARLAAIESRTATLTAAQVGRVTAAQRLANTMAAASVILALVVGAGSVVLMRRRVSQPLNRLLVQVGTVADGDYEHPIDPAGPQELRVIADAVDRMRKNMLSSSEQLVEAQNRITLINEHDRIAAYLHDLTIQRIFALGLMLQSTVGRQPALAGELNPLIDETDRIIRELRGVIFGITPDRDVAGLRSRVTDLVQDSARSLGFTPALVFLGPVDDEALEPLLPELLATLREALSNVSRHARATTASVDVAATEGGLRLTVKDNGVGISTDSRAGDGLSNFRTRAERLGGTSTIASAPETGTTLEWQVPVTGPL